LAVLIIREVAGLCEIAQWPGAGYDLACGLADSRFTSRMIAAGGGLSIAGVKKK
jgi:hypothetical protein